nr:hypothetical protein [Nitrospiraceae bacterium]
VRPYFLPVLFLAALVTGLAANRVWLYLKAKNLRTLGIAQVFLLIPLVYLPGTLGHSLGRSFIAYDHARDSLSVLPVNSVLFVYGDNPTFGNFYMQWVERYREDVVALNRTVDRQTYVLEGRSSYLFNKNLYEEFMVWKNNKLDVNFAALDMLSMEGRLFAVHPDAMVKILKARYEASHGPLDYMLLEKGADEGPANKFLLENYRKLNFERAGAEYSNDYFVEEIKNLYGSSLLSAAYITENQGESNGLYSAAVKLVDPQRFLPYITIPMVNRGQEAHALGFLHQIEGKWPDTDMADVAHVMEYIVLSENGSPAAAAKYEYLREHGLLVYLPGLRSFCLKMGLKAVTRG